MTKLKRKYIKMVQDIANGELWIVTCSTFYKIKIIKYQGRIIIEF